MDIDINLAAQINLLRELKLDNWADRLAHARIRLEASDFRILFVGEFSRGKTSFLNAILGKEILYVSPIPVTTNNFIYFGETPSAKAMLNDSLQDVKIGSLGEESYSQVDLTYPLPLCRENVVLIEQASITEAYEASLEAIGQADFVVMTLASDALYSNTERNIVADVKANGHQDFIILCSFIDRVPDNQLKQIKQSAYVRLPANPERIFFISAEQALQGDSSAQQEVSNVVQALEEVISNQKQIKQTRARQLLKASIEAARETLSEKQQAQGIEQNTAKMKASELHTAFQNVKKAQRRVLGDFDEFRQQSREVVQSISRTFIRGLGLQIEAWIGESPTDDLQFYVQSKLDREVKNWQKSKLETYLQQVMKQQGDSLQVGIDNFERSLYKLHDLLKKETKQPEFKVSVSPPIVEGVDLTLPQDHIIIEQLSRLDVLKSPEILLTLVASAAAAVLVNPFLILGMPVGIPLGVVGVGTAYWLGRNRIKNHDSDVRRRASQKYAHVIQTQADEISLAVWNEVNRQLESLQLEIETVLNERIEQVKSTIDARNAELRASVINPYDEIAIRLDEIERANE